MLIIGLTGGIGSGKSLVSEAFAHHRVPIIDTDQISRELVQPDQPALDAIAQEFGPSVLSEDGGLNRKLLRERIFHSPADRSRLEAILHPRIEARVREQIAQLDTPYCIVVIPLLVETGGYDFLDRVLVVDSAREKQIERTMQRDHIDAETVEKILASQVSRNERLRHADDVIHNEAGKDRVLAQVEQLHHYYLDLAMHGD